MKSLTEAQLREMLSTAYSMGWRDRTAELKHAAFHGAKSIDVEFVKKVEDKKDAYFNQMINGV